MQDLNLHYMDEAIQIAYEGMKKGAGGPFGAVIVKNNVIISKAHNCVLSQCDPTAHAEVTAIRLASQNLKQFDLSGCEIYTNGMPCPMCMGALYWARIDKIFYACDAQAASKIGFDDAKFYEEFIKPMSDRHVPCIQLIEYEAAGKACFSKWASKLDKTSY